VRTTAACIESECPKFRVLLSFERPVLVNDCSGYFLPTEHLAEAIQSECLTKQIAAFGIWDARLRLRKRSSFAQSFTPV
jgi:hypothetical protein